MAYIPSFATEVSDIPRNNRVYVESVNAFPDPVDGVITPITNTNYIFTKSFSFGSNQIQIPTAGQVEFRGTSELLEPILSDVANGTPLFIGDLQRFVIREVDFLNTTGTGKFVDFKAIISPSPTALFRTFFVIGFDDLGTFDGIFVISNNVVFVNATKGLRIINPDSKRAAVLINDMQFSNQQGTFLSIEDEMRFLSVDNIVGEPTTGDSLLFIDPDIVLLSPDAVAGGGSATIINCAFTGVNGGNFLAPGSLDETDPRFTFNNIAFAKDSVIAASTGFTGNTTPTTLADTSTFVKIEGTYISGYLERFTESNGVLTFIDINPSNIKITGVIQLLLTPTTETDIIEISIFHNGTEISSSRIQQTLGAVFQTPTSPLFYVSENVTLEEDDTIDIRMRNISNATNVIATDTKIIVKG